ncbi:hypothetical protein [Asticcacaulis taihuensis]|uniref:hypothetical protein n=1 Tax=Asticcacaulis taihuensis TaxID=260084 RepID=UPI0026F1EFC1|nr:hypothetical protein [Asticcacaulis taihuensis]
MTEGKCAIWGTDVIEFGSGSSRSTKAYDSPRAGGKYEVETTVRNELLALSTEEKAKLTSWLVDQRGTGVEWPKISRKILSEIKGKALLSTSQRINRFFLYCAFKNIRLGNDIYSYEYEPVKNILTANPSPSNLKELEIYAWTECFDWADFRKLERVLEANALLEFQSLTLSGTRRMEELTSEIVNSRQAFVAMWFDPSLNESYEQAIEPAIREAGYEPRIIRKVEHNNKIDDEIIAEIRRSKFVIADFTCGFSKDGSEAVARGGVYYEAGFAQGLGLPIIWTCREDIISHVHFDTRQYNHIVWKDTADLKEKLLNRIRATIT